MDECVENVPVYLCAQYELLSDIPEPSLSSLDESVISSNDVCLPVKEESYSDGEAIRTVITSTPLRRNDQRRSVSLMDVSKIDAFSSRPLGNMLASWETMGSQSSVGKSRDSGYVHSGSLVSVNSTKLSEIKGGSDQVNTIIDECTRLKRELEYSEVLINTLQESNNELRMKCAAAHNRISEMRLKCANHCDCCPQQYTKPKPKSNWLGDPLFLASSSSDSCSSEESDSSSPSPETVKLSCSTFPNASSHFQSSKSKVDDFLMIEEESNSDDSIETPRKIHAGVSHIAAVGGKTRNIAWDTGDKIRDTSPNGLSRIKDKVHQDYLVPILRENPVNITNRKLVLEKQPAIEEDLLFRTLNVSKSYCNKGSESRKNNTELNHILPPKRETTSEKQIYRLNKFEENSEKKEVDKTIVKDSDLEKTLFSSVGNLSGDVDKEKKGEPVFLANEMNGKIWVGSFKAWGDSSVRVAPKTDLLMKSPSSVKVTNGSSNVKLNVDHIVNCSEEELNISDKSSKDVLFPSTSPSVRTIRPSSLYSSSPSSPEIRRSRQINVSNISLNQEPRRPVSHEKFINFSRRDSVNITVSSRNDKYQLQISQGCVHNSPTKPTTVGSWENSKQGVATDSFDQLAKSETSSVGLLSYAQIGSTSKENLSNLGVSVSQSSSKMRLDSMSDRWKNFKSKFERLSLGSLISGDPLEESKSQNSSDQNSPSAMKSDLLLKTTSEDKESVLSTSGSLDSTDGKDSASFNSTPSQNMQECLEKANEYARELSRGLARLPSRLDYIKNIGKP